MGRETRSFRQTKGSGKTADYTNRNSTQANRSGGWGKLFNVFKKGGKV